MNIIEESFREKEEKPKKRRKLLLIFIIILVIAIISIIITLILIKEPERVVYLDGQKNNGILEILKDENEKSFYIPIKKMAEFLGYSAYDGDYITKSEEKNKCYIENENEVVTLSLNSRRIYRTEKSQEDDDYEYYDMKNQVRSFGGELYIESDEMEEVFNTAFSYDKNKNIISLQTLTFLVQRYNNVALDCGYEAIDENFVNQKAIFNDMLVVTKNDKKSYAVIKASNGNTILENKYTNIQYLPTIGDFIVQDNEKYGVISSNRENKVAVNYDSIDLIDKDAGLYLVEKDKKFGVVDLKGASKISVEYDEIGVDTSKFKENGIRNRYLLVDNLIPVRKDKAWGLYNKRGNLVVDLEYDSFGYIASSNKNAINLLIVPEYNVIVACKNEKYALINQSGQALFAPVVDDIYMTYEGGKYNYIMNYNDETMNVEDYLKQTGATRGNTSTTNTSSQANTSEQQQEEQQNGEQQEQQQNSEQQNGEQQEVQQNNQEQNNENNYQGNQ